MVTHHPNEFANGGVIPKRDRNSCWIDDAFADSTQSHKTDLVQ